LRGFVAVSLLFGLAAIILPAQEASSLKSDRLLGYTSADSKAELDLEQRFRAIPEARRAHENMRFLAAHPHNVGSEAQRKNAEWILAKYKKWCWDAHIEQFDVLYPTPKLQVLEMVAPTHFKAKLKETPLPDDPYTHETKTQLPGYNIYSADGDVTGPLVYANYGMVDDYAELERNGISVKGAIVITRYGGGWRGLKPSWPMSTAPSDALSIRIPRMMATRRMTSCPRAPCVHLRACSEAVLRTRPSILAIRLHRELVPYQEPRDSQLRTRNPS